MSERAPRGENGGPDSGSKRSAALAALSGLPFTDMHCHLDFLPDAVAFARQGAARGAAFFSNTVRPRDFERAVAQLGGEPNVRVGLGAHPWWVDNASIGEEELSWMEEHIDGARFIGEVGLDFSRAHGKDPEGQLHAFRRIAARCAKAGGKVLSIHAVKAAGPAIDVLRETGVAETCTCVFHWFSGSSDELVRARQAGCYFSVGPRMLATKKGRAYVRAIPKNRLLLETDLPSSAASALSYYEYCMQIDGALASLVQALQVRKTDLAYSVAARGRGILFEEETNGSTDALPAQA